MGIYRDLLCLIGRHHRLGRTVEWDGMDYRSVCRFCGTTMIKHGNARWRAAKKRKDTLLLTYQAEEVQPWPEEWSAEPPPAPVPLLTYRGER